MNDASQFRKLMKSYGGKPGKPSSKLLEFLRSKEFAQQSIEYLSGYVLTSYCGVSSVFLFAQEVWIEYNSAGMIPIALRDGLLIVGSCTNGDPIAVDVRENLGDAGYIGHESMWQVKNVREKFHVLAPGLGALVVGLDAGVMPQDYYEAISKK
jgi:hypothetical protein